MLGTPTLPPHSIRNANGDEGIRGTLSVTHTHLHIVMVTLSVIYTHLDIAMFSQSLGHFELITELKISKAS